MAVGPLIGHRFPYLPVELTLGEQSLRVEAQIDTGFDGDVAVPETTNFEQAPNIYRRWELGDGTIVQVPVYVGVARLGGFDPVPARIAVLGREVIVGRGLTDRYRVIFDHGERVIVEP